MSITEGAKGAGRFVWRWIKRLLILIFCAWLVYFAFIYYANYSDGARTGYVVKISRKGVLFKTYEGELNFGFPQVTTVPGSVAQNIWYFSVPSKAIADDVQKAAESGHKVTLFYKQKYRVIFFRGETEYLVYRVEKSE